MSNTPAKNRGNGHNQVSQTGWVSLNDVLGGLLTDLGRESERTGEFTSALRTFELAVQATPDDPLAWYNYGDTLLALGRYEDAVSALERAVEMSPSNELYHYDLGLALYSLRRYEDASNHSKFVVRSDPELQRGQSNLGLNAITNLALCYGEQGDWEKALETLRPAQSLAVNILFNLARFHMKSNSNSEAARLFKAAAILAPDQEDILHGAGSALMGLKKYSEAENYLIRATKADPSCVDAWYDRGLTLAIQNKNKQARSSFLQVIKRNPQHEWAYYDLACLDAREGKRNSAFRNLNNAVDRGLKDVNHIRRDRDLVKLHSNRRWKELITRVRELNRSVSRDTNSSSSSS